MRADKTRRRISRIDKRPAELERVARDVGQGLARGQRDDLASVARALAAHALDPALSTHAPAPPPHLRDHPPEDCDSSLDGELDHGAGGGGRRDDYWAGFAAAIGTLLAAYEAAHEHQDARVVALRAISSPAAESVLLALADRPATGAELATRLGLTPGAVSKILKALRDASLARILGGPPENQPLPERGAPKPHALTSMGSSLARECSAAAHSDRLAANAALR